MNRLPNKEITRESLGRPVKETQRDIVYHCPLCDDTTGHFYVRRSNGVWHCFKCDRGGRLLGFKPLSRTDATIPDTPKVFGQPKFVSWDIPQYLTLRQPHDWFLGERGVVMPLYFNSKKIGWQIRTFSGKPKYLTIGNRSMMVYNYDIVKAFCGNKAIVVEGIFDAVTLSPFAIAALGTGISDRQWQLIKTFDTVIFLLDSDAIAKAKNYCFIAYGLGIQKVFIAPMSGYKLSPWRIGRNLGSVEVLDPVTTSIVDRLDGFFDFSISPIYQEEGPNGIEFTRPNG
jgi:ribosomal protein L37AE/L43A